jgi:hypothetical protein
MNKKMLRQPSLRSDAIPERNFRRTGVRTSAFHASRDDALLTSRSSSGEIA